MRGSSRRQNLAREVSDFARRVTFQEPALEAAGITSSPNWSRPSRSFILHPSLLAPVLRPGAAGWGVRTFKSGRAPLVRARRRQLPASIRNFVIEQGLP